MDGYSKWAEILTVEDDTAETTAGKLFDEYICRFGALLSIHSDQGQNYESDLFRKLCQLMKIRKTRTSPRHPQGNSGAECQYHDQHLHVS